MCYTNIGTRKNIKFKNIKNTFMRIFLLLTLNTWNDMSLKWQESYYYVLVLILQFCSRLLILSKNFLKTSLGEFTKYKLPMTSTFQNICIFWWQIQVYSKSGLSESAMDWAGVVSARRGLAAKTLRLGNSYESWLGNGWTGILKRGQVSQ